MHKVVEMAISDMCYFFLRSASGRDDYFQYAEDIDLWIGEFESLLESNDDPELIQAIKDSLKYELKEGPYLEEGKEEFLESVSEWFGDWSKPNYGLTKFKELLITLVETVVPANS
jgi:hypothetical protein